MPSVNWTDKCVWKLETADMISECSFIDASECQCCRSHGRMLTYRFFSLFSSLEAASTDAWIGQTGSDWTETIKYIQIRDEAQTEDIRFSFLSVWPCTDGTAVCICPTYQYRSTVFVWMCCSNRLIIWNMQFSEI